MRAHLLQGMLKNIRGGAGGAWGDLSKRGSMARVGQQGWGGMDTGWVRVERTPKGPAPRVSGSRGAVGSGPCPSVPPQSSQLQRWLWAGEQGVGTGLVRLAAPVRDAQ